MWLDYPTFIASLELLPHVGINWNKENLSETEEDEKASSHPELNPGPLGLRSQCFPTKLRQPDCDG